jgi:DNA-binding PadR family transcriptional regulator
MSKKTNSVLPQVSPIEHVILKMLEDNGEMYAAQMVKKSKRVKKGTVYVTLTRMQKKGIVNSRSVKKQEKSIAHKPIRYFAISDKGKKLLSAVQAASAAL